MQTAASGVRSFGALLNAFTSLFHILAEAMGCIAADADDGQERAGEEEESDAFS